MHLRKISSVPHVALESLSFNNVRLSTVEIAELKQQQQRRQWRRRERFIQLFRERLSGKVHATILKGIMGGFEFPFFQRNLKELVREAMEMCLRELKESNKVGSTATVSGTVYWSYPILPFGIVACTVFTTTFLEIAVYKKSNSPLVHLL